MGGFGSGGGLRKSEEEKRQAGTLRPGRTDADYAAAKESKVLSGPWLTKIPEPEIPMGEIGRKKYDELTQELFQANKLTKITCMQAEMVARQWEALANKQLQGKTPSANDFVILYRGLSILKVAEDAKVIASPGGEKNRFARCGFSNRRTPSR